MKETKKQKWKPLLEKRQNIVRNISQCNGWKVGYCSFLLLSFLNKNSNNKININE